MSLIIPEKFVHIHRLMNTNIDGNRKVPYALTAIKGVGRRFAFLVCRKADIDIHKRAGELSEDDMERLATVMLNPTQYKIPDLFLNRQKDVKDGKYTQVLSTSLETKIREDLERMKKIDSQLRKKLRKERNNIKSAFYKYKPRPKKEEKSVFDEKDFENVGKSRNLAAAQRVKRVR